MTDSVFRPPFLQLDFPVTAKCNARCIFCQIWHNKNIGNDLPAEIWIKTAKRLKGFTQIEYVCIGGGEPFLYKDLFQLTKGLEKLKIPTTVVTNGSLLSDDNSERIIESGVNHIDFSIDAFEKKHDSMRGHKGIFKKCLEGMERLKKISPNLSIGVSTLICNKNIRDLPEFTDWVLNNLPVDGINFQAYNQVVVYQSKDWWREDPLWPQDNKIIEDVLDHLSNLSKINPRVANHPLQFQKFKQYFINPYDNLGIKCPAGTFNFSVSHTGDIIGCPAEASVGNISIDDPVKVYLERLDKIRDKASKCHENCHFLINCYFPLHWKRWEDEVKEMVDNSEVIRPGKLMLPPEIKEYISKEHPDYPALIKYKDYKEYDIIGSPHIIEFENRKKPSFFKDQIPYVFLCGDTSEVHRWGVDLDENDFFKQVKKLKELADRKAVYHTIVGIKRTNFHRLDKIYALIRKTRNQEKREFPKFNINPIQAIKKRFKDYTESINILTKQEGIEFRILDKDLDSILDTFEAAFQLDSIKKNDIFRSLGLVCKDVFVGPKNILLDLSGHCNLNCVYCRRSSPWNKEYWKQQHPELSSYMDLTVIKNVLKEASEIGTETVLLVGGGEPTLHPYFHEIIDYIGQMGMNFNFSTNGLLLNKYYQDLVNGRCGSITVSLSFASRGSFQKIRPGINIKSMAIIEKNVKALAELKRKHKTDSPSIIALYAICHYNYNEIIEMAYHAKELGVNTIWYQLVHLEDFSKDSLYMSGSEMDEVKRSLKEAKETCGKLNLDFHSFIDFEMKHYDSKKGDWSEYGLLHQGCFVGWHFTFIHLRREVFMCCGSKVVGILDRNGKGLKNLWFSDTYSRYRNDGLIMHKENPITLYGKPLYEAYCASCDNHDQNSRMITMLKELGLFQFVER